MSTNEFGAYHHHFRRVIPGDVEKVRRRLSEVLEDFNYVVLGDNPIQAKRHHTKSIWVADILECQAGVTIGLKPISDASTLATFDYAVEFLFTKGDRQALEREAEAIIALGTAAMNQTVCPACGTKSTDAIRFCRSCGAPVALNKLPTELEIMRLTAGASASQQEIVVGLVVFVLTLAVNLPMILGSDGKAVNIGWVLLSIGALIAAFFLLLGMKRLQRTLNPTAAPQPFEADLQLQSVRERAALPSSPPSVTEGTTTLMNPPAEVPLSVERARDTGSME